MFIFFHVLYFMALRCQFEPVLGATKKSPRSKTSLFSVSQYAGKKEGAESTLEARLLPYRYSHSFAKAEIISLHTLSQENCLEISGPRWQHHLWQRQLSP